MFPTCVFLGSVLRHTIVEKASPRSFCHTCSSTATTTVSQHTWNLQILVTSLSTAASASASCRTLNTFQPAARLWSACGATPVASQTQLRVHRNAPMQTQLRVHRNVPIQINSASTEMPQCSNEMPANSLGKESPLVLPMLITDTVQDVAGLPHV